MQQQTTLLAKDAYLYFNEMQGNGDWYQESPEYRERIATFSFVMGSIFDCDENPDKLECEIVRKFERLVAKGRLNWSRRAKARCFISSLVASAQQVRDIARLRRGEDWCDHGGGPLVPEHRDLDEPW
jgi:hypothetical protein